MTRIKMFPRLLEFTWTDTGYDISSVDSFEFLCAGNLTEQISDLTFCIKFGKNSSFIWSKVRREYFNFQMNLLVS